MQVTCSAPKRPRLAPRWGHDLKKLVGDKNPWYRPTVPSRICCCCFCFSFNLLSFVLQLATYLRNHSNKTPTNSTVSLRICCICLLWRVFFETNSHGSPEKSSQGGEIIYKVGPDTSYKWTCNPYKWPKIDRFSLGLVSPYKKELVLSPQLPPCPGAKFPSKTCHTTDFPWPLSPPGPSSGSSLLQRFPWRFVHLSHRILIDLILFDGSEIRLSPVETTLES